MTSYDNWKLASPDDIEDAMERAAQEEAAIEADADHWYNEHGQEWIRIQ